MMRTLFKDPERYESYWRTIEGLYFAGDWPRMRTATSGYKAGSIVIRKPGTVWAAWRSKARSSDMRR